MLPRIFKKPEDEAAMASAQSPSMGAPQDAQAAALAKLRDEVTGQGGQRQPDQAPIKLQAAQRTSGPKDMRALLAMLQQKQEEIR